MQTVLIADDSRAARESISSVLRASEFEVLEASNGKEAQQIILKYHPDLVMTDVVMPEMNGYELCRWIKQQTQGLVPVVFCSVKSEDFDLHWGKKQGCDAYISKPFQADILLDTVRKLLV
jgi:twitching motility two-component system response regulator PilH